MNHQIEGDRSYNERHRQSNVHNGLTYNGQHRQSEFYGGMIHMDLWYWLINHGVSRHETDKKPTLFLLNLLKWGNSQTNAKKDYDGLWQKGILPHKLISRS